MKILIINTSDTYGGAAVAAYRLMNALQAEGEQVKMLVRDKYAEHPDVISVGNKIQNNLNFYWERGTIFLHNRLSRKNLFDVSLANSGLSIVDHLAYKEADIIHLHWINQGMLSIEEIENIARSGKKIVWTMHDMWPFTGICHHAGTCINYESGCGECPYLLAPSLHDLSYQRFVRKQRAYGEGNITFVACSNWLKMMADKSPLTQDHPVVSIPNPIDTERYAPDDKAAARKILNLPDNKKIVLFAAVKTSDPRKGIDYLAEASLIMSAQHSDILFLIAGNNGDEIEKRLSLPAQTLGFVGPEEMPAVYNAADLFVTPSLQENLPNTIMEAMACGTPCVGFHTGGIPEMITHRADGYVAQYKDAQDLANGILWALFEADVSRLSLNARAKVISHYAQSLVAKQYIEIYHA